MRDGKMTGVSKFAIFWIVILTGMLITQVFNMELNGCISGKAGAPPVCGGIAVYAYWAVELLLLYMIIQLLRNELRKWKERKK